MDGKNGAKMKIKFSHYYPKLYTDNGILLSSAQLLQVLVVDLSELSKPFLDYDTDNGVYELPNKGKYLLLIYKYGSLFTTLRRWTEEKEKYYRENIGKTFDIVVEVTE